MADTSWERASNRTPVAVPPIRVVPAVERTPPETQAVPERSEDSERSERSAVSWGRNLPEWFSDLGATPAEEAAYRAKMRRLWGWS